VNSARYRASEGGHSQRLDDELVVLDVNRGVYFALNPVGAVIWDSLCAGVSAADVPAKVVERFDVTVSVATRETSSFIEELLSAGLLVPVSPEAPQK